MNGITVALIIFLFVIGMSILIILRYVGTWNIKTYSAPVNVDGVNYTGIILGENMTSQYDGKGNIIISAQIIPTEQPVSFKISSDFPDNLNILPPGDPVVIGWNENMIEYNDMDAYLLKNEVNGRYTDIEFTSDGTYQIYFNLVINRPGGGNSRTNLRMSIYLNGVKLIGETTNDYIRGGRKQLLFSANHRKIYFQKINLKIT